METSSSMGEGLKTKYASKGNMSNEVKSKINISSFGGETSCDADESSRKRMKQQAVATYFDPFETTTTSFSKPRINSSTSQTVAAGFSNQFSGVSSIDNYVFIEKIGEGTFGEVHKARNKYTGQLVALKRIIENQRNAQHEGFPITSLREIKLLKRLGHKNIISILEIALSREKSGDGSVYVVFPFMDHDLVGLLDAPIPLSLAQIKCYARQLIEGVAYLHSRNILHRDLKTANILINNKGELRIGDFGLARSMHRTSQYTGGVVTRWYRPPELVLGATKYSAAVDIWGVGCIILEMFSREPIFQGASDIGQLDVILNLCGSPEMNSTLFELPETLKVTLGDRPRKMREKFGWIDAQTLDLVEKMLELTPEKRISAEEALEHSVWTSHPVSATPSSLPVYTSSFHELGKRRRDFAKQQKSSQTQMVTPLKPSHLVSSQTQQNVSALATSNLNNPRQSPNIPIRKSEISSISKSPQGEVARSVVDYSSVEGPVSSRNNSNQYFSRQESFSRGRNEPGSFRSRNEHDYSWGRNNRGRFNRFEGRDPGYGDGGSGFSRPKYHHDHETERFRHQYQHRHGSWSRNNYRQNGQNGQNKNFDQDTK